MLVDGNVVYKSNTHAGSYASKTVKAGTVAGHMMRIKSTCVFEADALWSCICKLLELELSGCWKRRDLKRVLKRDCEQEEKEGLYLRSKTHENARVRAYKTRKL